MGGVFFIAFRAVRIWEEVARIARLTAPLVSAAECVIACNHLQSEWQSAECLSDSALMGGVFFIAFRAVRIWEELASATDGSSRLRSRMREAS